MVGVPVSSFRTEGHDDIGLYTPYLRDDGANGSCGLDLINAAVRVTQDGDLENSEHRGGGSQLRLPDAADFSRIASFSE